MFFDCSYRVKIQIILKYKNNQAFILENRDFKRLFIEYIVQKVILLAFLSFYSGVCQTTGCLPPRRKN